MENKIWIIVITIWLTTIFLYIIVFILIERFKIILHHQNKKSVKEFYNILEKFKTN